ncbi:hypothetical protein ACXIUS_13945 [Bosea thiooxidans]
MDSPGQKTAIRGRCTAAASLFSPEDQTLEQAAKFRANGEKSGPQHSPAASAFRKNRVPFQARSKKKMRAFRPASRRHGGSAGGIATAATCALITFAFRGTAKVIQIFGLSYLLHANRRPLRSKTLCRYIIQ